MTTVKNLHVLINNFVTFCNRLVQAHGDEVHLRLFLPSKGFHDLMESFENSNMSDKPELRFNDDNNFETVYQYVNVKVEIEEGRRFRIELVEGTQSVEKDMADPVGNLGGQSPNTDYTKPLLVLDY